MVMMNLPMKRGREGGDFDSITTMANCLMLLSQGRDFGTATCSGTVSSYSPNNHRVFECKTCNRQFPSFQALGGHRASHKKPKLGGDLTLQTQSPASPPKPKTHECSICGLEFAIGQALGGHMRRHRSASSTTTTTTSNSANDSHHNSTTPVSSASAASPPRDSSAVKKSSDGADEINDIKKIWGLDLNLTPFENDHLKFQIGKMAPPVDCFL